MSFLGDFKLGSTVSRRFCTVQSTGAPTTLSGSPVVSVYPSGSTTESTTGVTLTADYDSRTGLNNLAIVATAANSYARQTDYDMVITTGTVNSVSAVGYVVGTFSIENRYVPGLVTRGTAQAVTGTTIQLAAAEAFADDELIGATVFIAGASTGVGQSRMITDYANSTDTATVDTWTTTPTGTIYYEIYATAPASSSAPAPANVTQVSGAAVSTSSAQIGVNVVNFGGSAGTFASGRPETNTSHIAGSAVSTTTAQIGVNVVQLSTDATAADNAESFFDGTGYAGTNNVIPTVTTLTNKTGFELSATGSAALTEGYGTDGSTLTIGQLLYLILANLQEKGVSGTTVTLKKLDGSTTAATLTLDDGTNPTSIGRTG